jgi:putative transposase
MSRPFNFSPDEYYHLYNRGTEKRDVFITPVDWSRFILLLHLANNTKPLHLNNYRGSTSAELFSEEITTRLVDIGAYCLMPNHFHILVREKDDTGISKFMHRLMTAYTMYFNKKHERSGSLFQGKFKARHVADDDYLKYLFAYIHLNPVKLINPRWQKDGIGDSQSALKYLNGYGHSSFFDYTKKKNRPEKIILNRSVFPEYFVTIDEHVNELTDWLNFNKENIEVEPR